MPTADSKQLVDEESTGHSPFLPFFMLCGREAVLPIDVALGNDPNPSLVNESDNHICGLFKRSERLSKDASLSFKPNKSVGMTKDAKHPLTQLVTWCLCAYISSDAKERPIRKTTPSVSWTVSRH